MAAGTGAALEPGDAHLGDADGHGDGRLRVVVGRVLDPHRVDGDPDALPGQRREGDRHVHHRAGHRAVGQRGQVDRGALAVGRHGELGRDRVLAVGHDLQVEVVEGDRPGQRGTGASRRPGGWRRSPAPTGWTGCRPGWRWPRPGGRRAAGPASRPRCRCRRTPGRPTSRSILSSGMSGRDAGRAGHREGAGRGQPEGAGERGLGVGPGGVPELRSRVMTRLSRSTADEAPAARSRSWGMAMISLAVTPGMPTSAKPDRAARCHRDGGSVHVAARRSTVMRSVVKVRAGKVTTCPGGVSDAGPSGTVTGCPPSKVRVTLVIVRSGSPV